MKRMDDMKAFNENTVITSVPDDRATFIAENLDMVGVFNGSVAYAVPEYVVIDVTNACNCNCVACWSYSPLLGKQKASRQWRKQQLTFEVTKKLIDELARLGAKEIRLTGGGEPFMHPDVMKIIRHIKANGMICSVTTNFTLIDEKRIDELLSLGLDVLTASIWAGDSETYHITHPNQSKSTFAKIQRVMKHLDSRGPIAPRLVISNVITNLNYQNIDRMILFAQEVGAQEVYFAVVDPIAGATDALLLNDSQRWAVCDNIHRWQGELEGCEDFRLEGIDQFTRRLSNPESTRGIYDGEITNEVPCYAGWMFARIMADGNVCPCCRGVNVPTGNVYRDHFAAIWNGPKQKAFRRLALTGDKLSSPYFQNIGCQKSCDNLWQNLWMHERISKLTPDQRDMLLEMNNMLEGI